MIEKKLGKITNAKYGIVKDYDYLFGLQLTFQFDGKFVQDGFRYTINVNPRCNYAAGEREKVYFESIESIVKILKDAKCHYISELVGKPVELTIEDALFKSFRILTEVL